MTDSLCRKRELADLFIPCVPGPKCQGTFLHDTNLITAYACNLVNRWMDDTEFYFCFSIKAGRVALSVACLTQEPEVLGSIPGPATYRYLPFSFR